MPRPRMNESEFEFWGKIQDLADEYSWDELEDLLETVYETNQTPKDEKVSSTYGKVYAQSRIIKSVEDLKKEINFNDEKYVITDGKNESWGVSGKTRDNNNWIYNTNYLVELKWKLRGLEKPDNAWTEKWLDDLTEDVQLPDYQYKIPDNKPVVVALGDIHTGAIIEGDELIPDYSVDIARESLAKVATKVNLLYSHRPIHYLIGGDIIESFTGKNHKNTWKTIELHGAKAALEAFDLLRQLFYSTDNFQKAYLVGGNHDRISSSNKDDTQGQVAELIAGFFKRTTNIDIDFDPLFISVEIDGVQYIIHHGDKNFSKRKGSEIVLERGNSNLYNVIVGFHWHHFKIDEDKLKLIKLTSPAINKATQYSKEIGKHSPSGFMVFETNEEGFAQPRVIRV